MSVIFKKERINMKILNQNLWNRKYNQINKIKLNEIQNELLNPKTKINGQTIYSHKLRQPTINNNKYKTKEMWKSNKKITRQPTIIT